MPIGPLLLLTLTAAPEPGSWQVPRVTGVTIDGAVADWGDRGLQVQVLGPVTASTRPDAPWQPAATEFWPTARLGWDPAGLLVHLDVVVRQPTESGDLSQLWLGDAVELFCGTAAGEQWQLVVAPGITAAQPRLRQRVYDLRRNAALRATPPAAEVARQLTARGYTLEVRLPWQHLGWTSRQEAQCRLQLLVHHVGASGGRQTVGLFPQTGTSSNPAASRPLLLTEQPGAPITVAAAAAYQRLARTVVEVVATPDLVGRPVELQTSDRSSAAGALAAVGGVAALRATLSFPPRDRPWTRVAVTVGSQRAEVPLPDPAAARQRAQDRTVIAFQPSVFAADVFPPCDCVDPAAAEEAFGRYDLRVEFYNAVRERVERPTAVGRYGAVVTLASPNNAPQRRYLTLCRVPRAVDWWRTTLGGALTWPTEFGIAADLWAQEAETVNGVVRRRLADGLSRDQEFALVLAGLQETTPGADPAWVYARDQRWCHEIRRQRGELVPYRKLVHLPVGYDADTQRRWPLLLFLHGSGERGEDLSKVLVHGPPKLRAAGRDLPFVVVSPQCPSGQWWDPFDLKDLVDQLGREYRLDAQRYCLTGLSMGGFGTWDMLVEYPDLFAAAVPICGGGDPRAVFRYQHLPLWVFHGAKDPVVPLRESESMVAALRARGATPRFTVYPEAGHDSWTAAYDSAELYEWLLQQRRQR